MMNFINNGGLEMILVLGYFTYIMVLAKIEDRRTPRDWRPRKWHW